MKYAFLANPAVGHVNPLTSIAKQLISQGNSVTFYLPGINNTLLRKLINDPSLNINQNLEAQNIPCTVIPIATRQAMLGLTIGGKRGLEEVLHALKLFSAGASKYYKFLNKEFEKNRPDILVYDYTFFPAIAISEKLKIPRVSIYHSGLPFFEYPIPPIGSNYKYNKFKEEEFNQYLDILLFQEQKIRDTFSKISNTALDVDFLISPSSNDLNLITSVEEIEYPRKRLLPNTFFIGPCVNQITETFPFFKKKDKKLIYISLGTVFNNQFDLYRKMIEASINPNVEVVVSAGKTFKKLKATFSESNVHIFESVPQLNVLSETDLFLTHGGKNSISEALIYGVPMILFPAGGEQTYNATLIEYLCLGFCLESETLMVESLKEKINNTINNAKITIQAKSLSQHFHVNGARRAAELIEEKLGVGNFA